VLHIRDTLTGVKEPFETIEPGRVRMYVCGPTVYASAHIGHAMSYIFFDVVRRYLEYKGCQVHHVQNFTDVDDKIIERALAEGRPWDELAVEFAEEFLSDIERLNVLPANAYPRASASVGAIIEDVARLIELGKAYTAGGDVYFRVLSDPEYGKLSRRRLDEMRAGVRVESVDQKEHPMDFALWKAAKPGEPSWDSPWGPGRPGWHIECTTMVLRELGEQIDIHGGGNDLVFPHHENEIAQSEQLTGCRPFARYWMHNGMLTVDGEKMSKSIGNVISITDLLNRHDADTYRWFVLSSHYRRPINYTEAALEGSHRAVQRVGGALALGAAGGGDEPAGFRTQFEAAMDDDFNTARALAVLLDLARHANSLAARGEAAGGAAALLAELSAVLGLSFPAEAGSSGDVAPFVELLLELRTELRSMERWDLSDRVRDRLAELGVRVKDSREGTSWEYEK